MYLFFIIILLENVATRGLSKVKRLAPGQLRWEVKLEAEGRSGRSPEGLGHPWAR